MSWRALLLLVLAAGPASAGRAAELPAPVRTALAGLHADVPPGWACTLTTRRGAQVTVERYDPSLPPDRHWTLLATDGHPPSPRELDRYQRYRVTTDSTRLHPVFQSGDLDLNSARRLAGDATRLEFAFKFRDGLADALLVHLELRVVVDLSLGAVSQCALQLIAPYSPIVGLRIDELEVTTTLAPPAAGRPALPQRVRSRFHGRFLFLKTIAETLDITYTDYQAVAPPAAAPTGS